MACEPPPKVAPATSGVARSYPGTRGGCTATPESGVAARPSQLISRVAMRPPQRPWVAHEPPPRPGVAGATSGGGSSATPLGFFFKFKYINLDFFINYCRGHFGL